jgi:hypothetical protein
MRKLLLLALLLSTSAYAGLAFYTHETISGLYKICYYDYLGSEIAITIELVNLCPLSIEVP